MPSNTTYQPDMYPLDSTRVEGYGQGVGAICSANGTTNMDLTLTDDVIVTGLEILTGSVTPGDYAQLQVLVAGVPVRAPIPGPWYLQADGKSDHRMEMPLKAVAGMVLRVKVTTTTPLITPFVAVNFKLWKVLV